MEDVVEMELSQPVAVTHTDRIRALVHERVVTDGLDRPPVELVQFNVFVHCTRGSGHHMVDFEEVEMRPGTALWIRPGQVQRWGAVDDGFDADVVVFASSAVPDLPLFDRLAGQTSTAQMGDASAALQEQTAWMAAELESSGDTSVAAAVVGVILRLFARQSDAEFAGDAPRGRLATAFVDSIDSDIEERSVSWHAKRIGASTRSVARATIEILNQRPKEVIDSRVILEAQRRLAWADDDIATIARALRFTEASNFAKFFRARTGTSPSEFRAAVLEVAVAGLD